MRYCVLAGLVSLLFTLAGCWTPTGNVNYETFSAYTSAPTASYTEKGRVQEDGWANYLGFCNRAARFALEDALKSAKGMGANGLANVKWITSGGEFETPHCEAGFLIYWWGATAEVSASAIEIKESASVNADMYRFDPDMDADEAAQQMLDEISGQHGKPRMVSK